MTGSPCDHDIRLHTLYDTLGDTATLDTRFFISSLPCTATLLQQAVRQHWAIENSLHWVLDIAFREDECRLRKGHAAHNFSLLRRLALSLLRQDRTVRLGIKNKRLRAAWNPDYLLDILAS